MSSPEYCTTLKLQWWHYSAKSGTLEVMVFDIMWFQIMYLHCNMVFLNSDLLNIRPALYL